MIFTRTKRKAQRVCDDLTERGFAVGTVHGDLGQGAREQALRAFRTGKVDVLVATDVAARGIDVDNVTHVINYECPDDEKTYLHRIGRTGRAGHTGTAVTFVDWEDVARWQMIDRALKLPFKDPIETYSTSDHVYTGLNIPAGTGGTLPKASARARACRPRRSRTSARRARRSVPTTTIASVTTASATITGTGIASARRAASTGDHKAGEHKHGDKKHDEKAPAVARTEASPEDKPRRNRQRRRTRGGQASTPTE